MASRLDLAMREAESKQRDTEREGVVGEQREGEKREGKTE